MSETNVIKQSEARPVVACSDLLAGLSVMTVINLKHSDDEYLIYTQSGPFEGKYVGWLLTREGRPIINSQPTHENGDAAIAHMKAVVAACRAWESPANAKLCEPRQEGHDVR